MVIGTGIDIIEISRIQDAIDRNGVLFLRRIFTPLEQEYCQARHLSAMHYAGRFAAKEAAFKALGTGWAGKIRWVDVEVESGAGGPPKLNLFGVAAERFSALGATKAHLSISHSRDYAVAMVIFEN